ncbi:MAG TPA: hypothetical protein VFG54_21390 [Prolixibacteraceae bacterium]|nr:hypothetical protein [Prolixibacteraceae bacterium]
MSPRNDQRRKFLLHHPEELDILEEGIDFQTQKDYLEYSHSFGRGELTEEQTIDLGNMLYNHQLPVDGKKKALTLLAHLGSMTALRQLEKYYNNPDKELKQWAALALQECKMFVENILTDEMTGFISSGLGGHQNRMRYYFLVLPLEGKLFTERQKEVIKDEFTIVAKNLRSLVESFDLSDTHVGMTALLPMDIAVATFVESGIKNCNELGEFVFEFYYAANTEIPNEAEIVKIIRIVRND